MRARFLTILTGLFAALVLTFASAPMILAGTYNCGAYGAGTYQNNVCGAQDGGLADTGQPIWLILLAVALILFGTYMLYRTRKRMKAKQAYSVNR